MPFTFDFIKVKSYKGLHSMGSVQITGGDLAALEGKNVLVVEDIIDTGGTTEMYTDGAMANGEGDARRVVELLSWPTQSDHPLFESKHKR